MLVSSLIKITLGIKGQRVEKVEIIGNTMVARIVPRKRSRPRCSRCERKTRGYDILPERSWTHVSLWGIPVVLRYRPRRVQCKRCGIRVEKIPWSYGKSRLSLPLILVLSTFARLLSWEEVARLFCVHWNTVRAAVAQAVEYGLAHRDTDSVLLIGVDEISRRKGHTYVTNVYDIAKKRLLWTGDGRDRQTLEAFFREYGEEATKRIKAICCDMWAPYMDAIKEKAPQAILVFDKFHIVRHLIEAVDKVRKQEAREKDSDRNVLLKGSKYIFLKNPWNLTPKQKARLGMLEKLNLKINRAYLLKESFRQFWDYVYPGNARKFLKKWFWWATHSRLKPLRDFAWMLRRHEKDLMNYFKLRINAGVLEGLNRKAKVVSQRAYGYRTFGTFRLALYHVLGGLPTPEFTHKFV